MKTKIKPNLIYNITKLKDYIMEVNSHSHYLLWNASRELSKMSSSCYPSNLPFPLSLLPAQTIGPHKADVVNRVVYILWTKQSTIIKWLFITFKDQIWMK